MLCMTLAKEFSSKEREISRHLKQCVEPPFLAQPTSPSFAALTILPDHSIYLTQSYSRHQSYIWEREKKDKREGRTTQHSVEKEAKKELLEEEEEEEEEAIQILRRRPFISLFSLRRKKKEIFPEQICLTGGGQNRREGKEYPA